STDDYIVPNSIISQLMNKKIVFIVDPRPVGYELNTSLHIVHAICDDIDIVKFLEDSTHDNQQQFSFSPMQAFNVRRAQVLQWVRLHRFLFSTGIVGYFLTYWTLILYLLVNY
ncbi:hypothetical protein S83_043118, partial [Arachis hypogaea]